MIGTSFRFVTSEAPAANLAAKRQSWLGLDQMSTLGSSARRCNSEDNLASLLALPNDKRLTVARLRALGELNRLCSTSLLHCDTDLVWQPNL